MADSTPSEAAATPRATDLLPDATRRLVRAVDALADTDFAAPSGCAGWTRAHLVAHLALNAEGLAGALTGVVDGSPVPMYASNEQRDADITELGSASPTVLRSRLLGACTDLADAYAALPADARGTRIDRTPGGQVFAAGAVPLMRLREVEIHHADLFVGYGPADWSAGFATLLLDNIARRGSAPPLVAHAVDLDRTWTIGEGGPTVHGTAADLGWWLTGRGDGSALTSDRGELPQIGGW